jgi:hypothetical protein
VSDLARAIEMTLARHFSEVKTNTPLDVLAAHMVASLRLFEATLQQRADHQFFAPGRRNAP